MELKDIAEQMQPRSMAARDWVFQVIRTAIVRGALPGDMPLRQDEISAALNVSHIPVREAFRQLEAQGLVRIYPNRGAVVTNLTRKELCDIMDTRMMLEIGVLRAAVPSITADDVERARDYLRRFVNERDYYAGSRLNLQLHFALYSPCANQTALQLIDQMHANVDRYMLPLYASMQFGELLAMEEHQSLISACAEHNVELATGVLHSHLENTKELLLKLPSFA